MNKEYISSTNSLRKLGSDYDAHINQFTRLQNIGINIEKPVYDFFGIPPVPSMKLADVNVIDDKLTTLRPEYHEHISEQFTRSVILFERSTTLLIISLENRQRFL